MNEAKKFEGESRCKRKKVGCFIKLKSGECFAAANSPPEVVGECKNVVGKCGCVHAEERCINQIKVPFPALEYVSVSTSPCLSCAHLLVSTFGSEGTCYYLEEYRDKSGIEYLKKMGWVLKNV